MWWINFKQTVIPRKEPIIRQIEMGIRRTPNQKCVVVSEGEDPALVRASYDFKIDLHSGKFESAASFVLVSCNARGSLFLAT